MPPAVEAQSLNHWTTREIPRFKVLRLRIIRETFQDARKVGCVFSTKKSVRNENAFC